MHVQHRSFYFPFIIANVQNNSFFRWSVYFLSFTSQHKETQKSTCKPSIRDDTPFQNKKRGRPAPRKKTSPQHRIASEVHPVKAKAGANLRQQASLSRHWAGSAPDRVRNPVSSWIIDDNCINYSLK